MACTETPPPEHTEEPPDGPRERPPNPARRGRSRGLIGLATLLGIAVVVAVIMLATRGGGDHRTRTSPSRADLVTTPTGPTRIVAELALTPPGERGRAGGNAEILTRGRTHAIAIVAHGLAPNRGEPPDTYAVWLYSSPRGSRILGIADPGVSANGRLQATGRLPADAARYRQLLITLETRAQPRRPGKVVLVGTLTGLRRR